MTALSDQLQRAAAGDASAEAREGRLHITLRQLEVFVATARAGSTRAAADKVSRSQSAASSALADLEAAFDVLLFDRVGRRLVLNENGRALLPKAVALLEQAGDVQQLFSAGHAVPLRVAASLTVGEYLLPAIVAQWKLLHPASRVQLNIVNTSEVIAAVAGFDVDIGFIEGPQTHRDLLVRPWLHDEMVIIAAPGHALGGRLATPRQLQQAHWALREQGSGTREAADRWLLKHVGALHVEFELGSAEAIKRLVAAGDALGFVSRRAVEQQLAQGELLEIRTRLPRAHRRLAMVLHRDKRLARGTEDFVRHCMELAREE
jgi:DNA-binding transcriptional LysR family regulator